ncbi:MAG: hypothetical protein IJC52_01870 [Clostridia bacterium]|nr:hypothetical protein [Clostridia bacterium]
MDAVKGTVEATIQLTKANCYYMTHGVCSLSIIDDFSFSAVERLPQNDLLYCPRLYKHMQSKDKDRAIPAIPCDCGHVQILSGHQRACIAERKGLLLSLKVDDDKEARPLCAVCGGQTTLHSKEAAGKRILSLTVRAIKAAKED